MSEVYFNGPAGRIEGKYVQSTNPKGPIALVLHPHPQHGGTMNNKVVYNTFKTLVENDFTVLRINFRGVGKSMGTYDEGIGEMMDAATALDWLQSQNPMSSRQLIAGFSFGSWVAMQLIMRRPEITDYIAIAPPVEKYDFSFLAPCPISGLILQGNMDSVVSEESVSDLAQKLDTPKYSKAEYKVISGADHFFRDKIDELNSEINDFLLQKFAHNRTHEHAYRRSSTIKPSQDKKLFLD